MRTMKRPERFFFWRLNVPPIGKRLLYKLAELALKEGNIDEAEAYYREFSDLAGDDPRQQLYAI